jgi:hypothetical protein
VTELAQRLRHLTELLDSAANELNRAAGYYEHTDRAAAASIDETYPPAVRPVIRVRGD